MRGFTSILEAGGQGDGRTAGELFALVYSELRRLAAHKMASAQAGHTLQPTALVHEAWLKLASREPCWKDRAHFFATAAEAMRCILVDSVRRRESAKRGGGIQREELAESQIALAAPGEEILAVHEALDRLAAEDASCADLVKLRYFAGMSMAEAADALGLPLRTAERNWSYARAWLRKELGRSKPVG